MRFRTWIHYRGGRHGNTPKTRRRDISERLDTLLLFPSHTPRPPCASRSVPGRIEIAWMGRIANVCFNLPRLSRSSVCSWTFVSRLLLFFPHKGGRGYAGAGGLVRSPGNRLQGASSWLWIGLPLLASVASSNGRVLLGKRRRGSGAEEGKISDTVAQALLRLRGFAPRRGCASGWWWWRRGEGAQFGVLAIQPLGAAQGFGGGRSGPLA